MTSGEADVPADVSNSRLAIFSSSGSIGTDAKRHATKLRTTWGVPLGVLPPYG